MKYLVKYTILIAMMPFVLLACLIVILWEFDVNPKIKVYEHPDYTEHSLKDALKEYFNLFKNK